jgi:hypothetical protein
VQILSLPASTGAAWLRDGWRLLKRQPLGLAAMVVMYSFILLVPTTIPLPFLGIAVLGVLSPFATVGLMAALREVDAGRPPTPGVFLQPLQDEAVRRVLFRLGLVHAGLMVFVTVVAQLFTDPTPIATDQAPGIEDLRVGDLALVALLYAPVMVAMWFAPLLAAWHALGVGKSMFGSAVACWRNKGAMLVYGLLLLSIIVGVTLIVVALLGALLSSTQAISLLMAPLALVITTFVQASFYPMYRSIFAAPGSAV